ncbi:hypothetical protein ACQPW3_15365 [Actinosynnema sp. CA-248983]
MAVVILSAVLLCHGHAEGSPHTSFEAVATGHDTAAGHGRSGDDVSHVDSGTGGPRDAPAHQEPFCGPVEGELAAVQAGTVRSAEPGAALATELLPQGDEGVVRRPAAEKAAMGSPTGSRLLLMVCVSRR